METGPVQEKVPTDYEDKGLLHYLEQSDPEYFRLEVDRKEFDPGNFQRDEWYDPPEWEDEINIPAFLRRLPDQGKEGGQARRRCTHLPGGR